MRFRKLPFQILDPVAERLDLLDLDRVRVGRLEYLCYRFLAEDGAGVADRLVGTTVPAGEGLGQRRGKLRDPADVVGFGVALARSF